MLEWRAGTKRARGNWRDLAIHVFSGLGYPIKIIGFCPGKKRFRSLARSNGETLGWQPDEGVADCCSKCRAPIFPGEEDFGIVPLEGMACGKPVIAYGRGGTLETVVCYDQQIEEGRKAPTGLFFYERTLNSVIDAVERFIPIEKNFDPVAIRNHALQWNRNIFREKIK